MRPKFNFLNECKISIVPKILDLQIISKLIVSVPKNIFANSSQLLYYSRFCFCGSSRGECYLTRLRYLNVDPTKDFSLASR